MAQQLTDPLRRQGGAPRVLPLLDAVLDLEVIGARLRALSPIADARDPVVISARLIDYKAGDRGVIAYELESAAGGGRFRVLGKHFRDPVKANRVQEMQQSLWSDVFRGCSRLGVPEPFGWVPDLSLVLYVPVKGRHLDRAILTGRADTLQQAAEWLARLHASGLRLDRRLDLGNELVNLGKWAEVVGTAYPDEASAAERISENLQEGAAGLEFELDSPIHKDFHYRHVVVGEKLAVLDFDEMRYGDRNFDLAHFSAYLRLLCIRLGWPPARFRTLEQSFLEAYARGTGWAIDERFAYFTAYTCLKIARQLCSTVGVQPPPTGAERRRQVRAILEHAQALEAALA